MTVASTPVEPLGEHVEHIDVDGRVIEIVTRGEVRRRTLRHRCSYVFHSARRCTTSEPEGRSRKTVYPGAWDPAFGGICGVGESWEVSAARELNEEAGIAPSDLQPPGLVDLGEVRYEADDGRIVGRAFVAVSSAPLSLDDGEVVEVTEVPIDAVPDFLASRAVSADSVTAALPLLMSSRGSSGL